MMINQFCLLNSAVGQNNVMARVSPSYLFYCGRLFFQQPQNCYYNFKCWRREQGHFSFSPLSRSIPERTHSLERASGRLQHLGCQTFLHQAYNLKFADTNKIKSNTACLTTPSPPCVTPPNVPQSRIMLLYCHHDRERATLTRSNIYAKSPAHGRGSNK